MPLVDVTYDSSLPEAVLERLGQVLPDIVAEEDQRAEQIRHRLSDSVPHLGLIGVWPILHEGSWAQ